MATVTSPHRWTGGTIRVAAVADFDEAARITLAAYVAVFGEEGISDYREQLLDVAGRAAAGTVLVAEDDAGSLLGTVTYVPGPGTELSEFEDVEACGIRMLAVAPECQGRGAGRALTEACLELGRSLGRRRVVLHSTEAMKVARAMYERLGFVRVPRHDVHLELDDGPFVLLAYELELDPDVDVGTPRATRADA
jgi:ribosomal protein S18 acetylase RimI-like enzyme